MNQDLRTNIYNLPYKCPRCECRNFKTVYQLRSHLETDHVFFNNKRQRPKILDYDIRRDTLSGSKSPTLKQFMDENHRLEEELRELKKSEKINKVLRRSSQQTDSSAKSQSRTDSPRRRTERLDPDYPASMSSAASPRIQFRQNNIQHSPTSGQFEFPSPMTNDRYMTDRVDSLSHDMEKSRENQWKTSDALYQSKDVLQGIEVASEIRNQDQAKVLTVLDKTLQQRSDELDKAYKDINQLKEERKVLMNQVEIMTKDRKKIQTHNTSNPSDLPCNVRNESIIDDTAISSNSVPEDLINNIQQMGNPGSTDVGSHRSQISPSTVQPARNLTPVQLPASLPQNTINNPSSFLPIFQQYNPWLMANPTPTYQPMLQQPVPTHMTDHRSSFQPVIQPQTQGQMTSNYTPPFRTIIQPHFSRQTKNYTVPYQSVVQQNLPEQHTNNRHYHHPLIQQNIPENVGSQQPLIQQNIPGHIVGDSRSQQPLIQQNIPGYVEDSRSQQPLIQQNIPSQLTNQTPLQPTIQQHTPEQMTSNTQSHHPIQQTSYEQISDHISPEQSTEQHHLHQNPVPTVKQIQPISDSPQMIPQRLTDPHNEQMPDSKLEIYKLKIATQEEEMENMNSHLSVIKQKASKELRTKDSQLATALRRSEKLEEDRKVLLLEMEDLLSKAGFDNEKLRYELQLKEKELQNLNQKLERTKHGQAQIVSETFDLYKDAEGNIEELREKLRLKEKELMQSKMKVETIKMAHDKVLEENELVAKEAEKSGQTLKYLLDGKDKELNSVQQELIAIKEKEGKLHQEKTDLELKIRNSEKTQQNLKLEMKEKERDLSNTKSELEKVQTYLKNTAAKEKVARAELEDFITGLIERSEKAENQLKTLKLQVQAEEELQISLQEAEDEATRSLEELAAAIPKKKREKPQVIEKSPSKPNLVKQKKIKTVRYSDEDHNQHDSQKPTSRRTKSHKYNPTYESEDSLSPTPPPRKEHTQKRRQSPASSPVRSSNREYDSDHRHGNPRESESSKSPTGLSDVDRRPEKPPRRNIEKVGKRDELPRNTLANEERYQNYPRHGSYHQPNQQTSFKPVETQGRMPSSYVSQPGSEPRLRLITPRQPLDPGSQYSSQLNNQNYHSPSRLQTPVNHMVINNPHQISNGFIAPLPINQQTVPANSAQMVPINPSNIQRPSYAASQMHPSLQDPHNLAKGNVQQSGQFSSLPMLGSAQIAQQHGMQSQSLPVSHMTHGANLGNGQSPKPDITNLEDLTLRGILTPEEQTAILSSRLHKAMVQQEFLTGKKPLGDDDLRLVELQSSDDSEQQFTKKKKKPANNQKALTSSLENRLTDLEELGVLGDQSPTEYENISSKKNHGTARGILLSDSIDATGNDLSVDENGIMWDDAGTTTYASEDLESYRFSPSGSETAGDIDSHQLLSSSSNSNNSNSPRNIRQDTMGQSLDKLNQTPKGKDFHDIRSKISQRRAEREDLTLAIGILKGQNNLSTDDSDLSGYYNDIQNKSKTGRYKGQKLSPLEEDSDGLYKHRYPSARLNQQDSSENEGSYSLSPARKSRYLMSQQSAPVSNAKSRFLSDMRQTSRSPSPKRSANLTSSSYSPIRSDSRSYSPNLSSSPRSRENSYLGSDLALKYGDPNRMSPKPAPRSPSRYEQFYSNRVQSPNPHLLVTDTDARMNQSFSSRPISRSPSPSRQFQQPVRETMEKQNIQKDEKKFAFLDDQYRVIPKMNNSPTVTMVPETKTSDTVPAGEKIDAVTSEERIPNVVKSSNPEIAAGTPNQNKDVTDCVYLENEDKPEINPTLAPQLNNEIDVNKSIQENLNNQKESETNNELERKDNVNDVSLSPDIVKYNEVPLKQAKSFLSDVEETEPSSDEDATHAGRGPIPRKEESTDMDFESDIEKLATPHKLGRSGIIGVKGSSKKSGPLLHKKLKTRRHYADKDKMKDDSSSAFSDSGNKTGQKKQEEAKRRRVALFRIFSYLDFKTLCLVSQICREWKHVSRHPALWKNVKLKNHTISSSFLVTISQWCKQTEYLTLEGLRTRSRYDDESLEEYQRNIRGCVEAGLEEILKNCQDSLVSLRIINCGNILTDKCLWLVSGYSRLLQKFHYISDVDPIGPETLWAIGGGCPGITTLIIPPLFPCKKPKVFNNKCLMLLARFYPEMLEIGIGGKEIDQGGLLPLVSGCQRLTFLQLDNMKELTEDLATALCRAGLRHVNTLELRNMPIAPKAIVQFYSSCHHLKRIQIDIHFTDYYEDIKNKKQRTDYKKKIQQLQDLRNKAGLGHILKIYAEQVE
ncbi:uncharacterized protein LOC126814368 [Patella vulgata]|uniref:uncharacterized protein LOC126814368 n=1 Tax=Patella vulgata TaxID=6465 RepID=UPI002180770F|nr:uncharacterized protein LOC126814368 [Patella vulgata]